MFLTILDDDDDDDDDDDNDDKKRKKMNGWIIHYYEISLMFVIDSVHVIKISLQPGSQSFQPKNVICFLEEKLLPSLKFNTF